MKTQGILDKYLLLTPGTRAKVEWSLLLAAIVAGFYFPIFTLPFLPYSRVFGVVLGICGLVVHRLSHAAHKHAHDNIDSITHLVTAGIYSKIRHPGYTGLILIYMGLSLVGGTLLALSVAFVLSALAVLTALREEVYLMKKFEGGYRDYMRQVPFRFLPKMF